MSLAPLAALIAAPVTARAAGPTAMDRYAERLFNQGLQHMMERRFEEGCPLLEESYFIAPLPGALFTLAECEAQWGKLARAVDHYADYLAQFEAMTQPQKLRQMGREVIAAKNVKILTPTVPRLKIRLASPAPAGAVVQLNGQRLDIASLARLLPVDPGDHTITVEVQNARRSERFVRIAAGEVRTISLISEPPEAGEIPARKAGGKVTEILVAGAAVSAASVGAGVILLASASEREGDDVIRGFGVGALIMGFAIGTATAGYAVWPDPSSSEQRARVRVSPIVSPTAAGIGAAGRF
jgi:hypothetical protein